MTSRLRRPIKNRCVACDFCVLWLGAAVLLIAIGTQATVTNAQQASPADQNSTRSQLECRYPADPHRRQHGCNDKDFGLDETLAGEWNHFRQAAKRIGITPTASYVGALQTNPSGGSDQVWSYAGQLSLGIEADFNQLIKARGLSAYVGMSWGTGSNLASSLDSSIFTSGLYAPSYYLGEMYLQQRLLGGRMTILGGRIAAANGFATLPVFANYVNYGINPTPYSFGINDATFFGPPTGTEWGAQATYSASPSIRIAAGGFNTNLNSANGANHGADFALQEGNKGVLAIGEVDYLHNQSASSVGKPGQIALGGLFNNNSFPSLVSSSNRVNGYGGVYLMGQQMVFRPDGPGSFRGATLWGAWALSPRDTVSPVTTFWGAGFCYEGLIATRKHDVFSSGLIVSEAGRYGPPNASEKFLELNYQWNHSQYLVITPHAQYLWKQENYDGRNATVIGVQIALIL